jgi:hypothetical protein
MRRKIGSPPGMRAGSFEVGRGPSAVAWAGHTERGAGEEVGVGDGGLYVVVDQPGLEGALGPLGGRRLEIEEVEREEDARDEEPVDARVAAVVEAGALADSVEGRVLGARESTEDQSESEFIRAAGHICQPDFSSHRVRFVPEAAVFRPGP